MKKTILLFVALCITSGLLAQSGWQVISPGNSSTGQLFKDIKFFDSQTGWLLGYNKVTGTTNGGVNWNTYTISHLNNQLTCFWFYSRNIGWAAENNFLNYTSNSGTNWSVISTSISNPRSICFRDIQTGWVCGDAGMIKKTTDGGYNWISQVSGTDVSLKSIAFADANTGICAGDWGMILSTTNGGANWMKFYDTYIGFYTNVKFKNNQTGFVTGNGGFIYRTTNSGFNWTPYYINSFNISGVYILQDGTMYAFGTPGMIYRSTDSGNSWNQVPPNGLFSQVFAASVTNEDMFWVTADSVLIYNSTNLGGSWNVVFREYITKEHLNSVFFTDNINGFACGERGILLRSTNGGSNWIVSNLGTNYSFKDIKFVNGQTGFISGWNTFPNGVIFKTTNGGGNWQAVYSDTSQLNSIHFINSVTGWAAGNSGYYLVTTNSGSSWVRSRYENLNIEEICFINSSTGFIGRNPGLYRTTNGGQNWIQASVNQTGSIQYIGNTIFASTRTENAYFMLKSTDAGISWQQYQVAGGQYKEIFFANEQTGWLAAGNSIRKTTNGGANWFNQVTGNNSIYGIKFHFTDENYGWCVGMYGGIMRTTTGGIGIEPISTEIPQKYELMQNYPNPFNPITKLKFQMPKSGFTKIVVFDVTGREIAIIVNENLKPGTYEIEWDATNIPSGVYFCSLITNEFTQTRKMVLVK